GVVGHRCLPGDYVGQCYGLRRHRTEAISCLRWPLPTTPQEDHPMSDTASPLDAFIAGLPKAELHVHHVGSASPRIVAELAARHPDSKVPTDPAALAEYFV